MMPLGAVTASDYARSLQRKLGDCVAEEKGTLQRLKDRENSRPRVDYLGFEHNSVERTPVRRITPYLGRR